MRLAETLLQVKKTEMGIPVFWTTAKSDPPWKFKVWFDQFLMAIAVKENVIPEIILEEPKPVTEKPEPRLEAVNQERMLLRQQLAKHGID